MLLLFLRPASARRCDKVGLLAVLKVISVASGVGRVIMRLMHYWIVDWLVVLFIVCERHWAGIVMFFVVNRAGAIVVFLCVGDGSSHHHQKR